MKNTVSGIATGISFVDEMTGGIHKGELSTLLAYTGHCKTTLAVNIAYNSLKMGQNVLYLSLEVNKENIYFDFISRHSNDSKFKFRVGHYDLKKRKLKPEQWDYVKNKIMPDFEKLPGNVYVADETELENYSTYSLEAKFREIDNLAIEQTGHGIDVVVIDHVQLLKFGGNRPSSSTGEVINEYVSWFRQNAMNWLRTDRQVAFLLLSQANRTGYSYAKDRNGKYDLTSMAEANELERASTLILSIFAEPEMKDMGVAKVQILKYRDSRDENEPTEVNVDLPYYVFGDLESVHTSISQDLGDEAIEALDNGDDILDSFKGIIPDDFSL